MTPERTEKKYKSLINKLIDAKSEQKEKVERSLTTLVLKTQLERKVEAEKLQDEIVELHKLLDEL